MDMVEREPFLYNRSNIIVQHSKDANDNEHLTCGLAYQCRRDWNKYRFAVVEAISLGGIGHGENDSDKLALECTTAER